VEVTKDMIEAGQNVVWCNEDIRFEYYAESLFQAMLAAAPKREFALDDSATNVLWLEQQLLEFDCSSEKCQIAATRILRELSNKLNSKDGGGDALDLEAKRVRLIEKDVDSCF
jgi:hypothetical protein